jgi:hypothetical protein
MNDNGQSVFSQFLENPPRREQLEPEIVRRGPQPLIPIAHHKSSPSERLLSWIINFWPSPIISLRDIRVYGPYSIRDAKDAVSVTQTLAEFGWLVPVKAHRRDRRVWRIVRDPRTQP